MALSHVLRVALGQRPLRFAGARVLSTRSRSARDTFADIVYGQDTGVRTVQFNRPAALNALSLPMVEHLTTRLQTMETNRTINSIVLSGAGDRAFCAGGDIRALYENGRDPSKRHLALDFFRNEYRLNYLMATTEKPIVAFLNGLTMGGGVGVSLHGKFVVATEKTVVAMPETAIGFFPDVGASYLLPRVGRRIIESAEYTAVVSAERALVGQGVGTYLGLTGERLQGKEVIGFGLATHYLETVEYADLIHNLTRFSFEDDMSQQTRDEMVYEAIEDMETDDAVQEIDTEYLETMEAIFGAHNANDTIEGIFKRLESHGTAWSKETLATLKKMSPLSLKVTLEEIRQGAKKSCEECFQMEYRIAARMLDNPDFFEGVRAQVVDKDRSPKWTHSDVTKISREQVLKFFEPLDDDGELVLYPSKKQATE